MKNHDTCRQCGKSNDTPRYKGCSECRAKDREKCRAFWERRKQMSCEYMRDWRERRREAGVCVKCKADNANGLLHCDDCREKARVRTLWQRERLRFQVMQALGGVRCACCGEENPLFLTIDHVMNDGHEDRQWKEEAYGRKRVTGSSGHSMLVRIVREGCPRDRYQVLCFNCNCGKQRNGGRCPHDGTDWVPPYLPGEEIPRPRTRRGWGE